MTDIRTAFESRPFRSRNADDYPLSEILDLFVDPLRELDNPFGFGNTIIKGRMGSGKTMYLRANFAYHMFGIVPALLNEEPPIIPISIKLNEFQHIREPIKIYNGIIIRIIEGIIQAYKDIRNASRMADIHQGIQALPDGCLGPANLSPMVEKLIKLTAEEYRQVITKNFSSQGGLNYDIIAASFQYEKEHVTEIKSKAQPGISDIQHAYSHLLEASGGKILLLLDEAGSLAKSFFADSGGLSLFETLMNQLRTTEFIRTKIAIYPNTPADILFETRYGDVVELSENVFDNVGYEQFRRKALALIERYVTRAAQTKFLPRSIFQLHEDGCADALEQIIFASGGNMRRLVQTLDQSMSAAFDATRGGEKVSAENVLTALKTQSHHSEGIYSVGEREFLEDIAKVCRSRSTFRFQFPYKSPILLKYASKLDESNLLNIVDAGAGRKKATYAFDYAYCINHDLPTHYIKETERIDKLRSTVQGEWIQRTTQISEEMVIHAKWLKKIRGRIGLLSKQSGFIVVEGGKEYWFLFRDVMEGGPEQLIVSGKSVQFYPSEFDGQPHAVAVELL